MVIEPLADKWPRKRMHYLGRKKRKKASRGQCDQMGNCCKLLTTNLLKSSPKILVIFWAFSKRSISWKNCFGIYLGNFGKHLGYIFTPISGHTGLEVDKTNSRTEE